MLAIDYGLRPVLSALGSAHVVGGLFVLDKLLELRSAGGVEVHPDINERLEGVIADFAVSVRRADLSAAAV